FDEIGENALYVIQRRGPLVMAGQLQDLRGAEVPVQLLFHLPVPFFQPRDLFREINLLFLAEFLELFDFPAEIGKGPFKGKFSGHRKTLPSPFPRRTSPPPEPDRPRLRHRPCRLSPAPVQQPQSPAPRTLRGLHEPPEPRFPPPPRPAHGRKPKRASPGASP